MINRTYSILVVMIGLLVSLPAIPLVAQHLSLNKEWGRLFQYDESLAIHTHSRDAVNIWGNMSCLDIAVAEHTYVLLGNLLAIYDMLDLQHPQEIGYYHFDDSPVFFEQSGHELIFAQTNGSLWLVDVSQPNQPVLSSTVHLSGQITALTIHNYIAYVGVSTDSSNAVNLIDITYPSTPEIVETIEIGHAVTAITLESSVLYIGDSNGGISWYSQHAGGTWNLIQRLVISGTVQDLMRQDSLLVAACDTVGAYIFNTNSADSLALIGQITADIGINRIHVMDGNVLVADKRAGTLQLWDVTTPAPLSLIASTDIVGSVAEMTVQNDTIYLATQNEGFQIWRLTDESQFDRLFWMHTGGIGEDLAVKDTLLYYTNGVNGMRVLDISNPMRPVFLGEYDTDFYYTKFDISGNVALLTEEENGMDILNVSDPGEPTFVHHFGENYGVWDVQVMQDTAYLAAGQRGILMLDIHDPAMPVLVDSVVVSQYTLRLFYANGFVYAMDGNAKFVIIDPRTSSTPAIIGEVAVDDVIDAIYVSDQYAYVGLLHGGLVIFDISQPDAPTLVSEHEIDGRIHDILVNDDTLFLSVMYGNEAGLHVFDLSDISSPTAIGNVVPNQGFLGVTLTDGYVFGTSWDGLWIFENDFPPEAIENTQPPQQTELLSNYPNPFNPSTHINYVVQQTGMVELRIYNLRGALLRTLVHQQQLPGKYSVMYYPEHIASGLYFYQLYLDHRLIQSQKMILLQ